MTLRFSPDVVDFPLKTTQSCRDIFWNFLQEGDVTYLLVRQALAQGSALLFIHNRQRSSGALEQKQEFPYDSSHYHRPTV